MTLVTDIITDAFRQSNLIAIGTTPTSAQQVEALRYLNRIVRSVFGQEVGDSFTAIPIGRNNIERPSGYPYWDTIPDNDWFIPENTRAVLNLTESLTLHLHPDPDEGTRFAVIDVNNSLATYPVTIQGNGRLIENSTSITLNQSGYNAEWFYRADLGNWQKYAPLIISDTFPFPEEFDFFFIIQLAKTLNPQNGIALDPQTEENYRRYQRHLRSRYTQIVPVDSELALIRYSRMTADRDTWGTSYRLYNPNSMFNRGWPW